jgi:predicted nucleic acid-binding protein
MIVIADTSVLLNLALVGQIQLLRVLFGTIVIPVPVKDEFERLAATTGRFAGLVLPEWVRVDTAAQTVMDDEILQQLDPGEAAAILLAVKLHADAVLMDESEGRAIAQARGLRTIGILGILIQARQAGHLAAVRPVIEALRSKAKFRLSDALVDHALAMCQE